MPLPKRNSAVALRYHPQAPFLDAAPRLVAKGEGLLADRILALAKASHIPIQKDPDMLALLAPLDLDSLIPPSLFQAVAVVLASLYQANARHKGSP